jgi:hypothetical protein
MHFMVFMVQLSQVRGGVLLWTFLRDISYISNMRRFETKPRRLSSDTGVILRVCALLVATVVGTTFPLSAQPDTPTIPKAARKLLDEKWKGWRLAGVDPQATSCHPDGQSGARVEADLDSDGRADLALLVTTPGGVRLAAIFNRIGERMLHDVDGLGETTASAAIGVQRRGTKFRSEGSSVDSYFSADTIVAQRCGAPATAYVWNGLTFTKVVIAQ